MGFVLIVLIVTAFATNKGWIVRIGVLVVFLTFGHATIADRLQKIDIKYQIITTSDKQKNKIIHMKRYIKLLVLACIIAALSGALMYVLFLIGFEFQSCVIFAVFFIFVASEIVVDSNILGCAVIR